MSIVALCYVANVVICNQPNHTQTPDAFSAEVLNQFLYAWSTTQKLRGQQGFTPLTNRFLTKIRQVISMDFRLCNLGSQPELCECMNDLGGTNKQTSCCKESLRRPNYLNTNSNRARASTYITSPTTTTWLYVYCWVQWILRGLIGSLFSPK